MSKKYEKEIMSAIKAMVRAKDAYGKISHLSSGFLGVRIEPRWAWYNELEDSGAEAHVTRETLETLAELLGEEIKDTHSDLLVSGVTKRTSYSGFVHDGVWFHSLTGTTTLLKGEK